MERWQNKVAVVTGASSGIGAAVCWQLLEKGMIVVGMARRLEKMEDEFKVSLPRDHQRRFHAVKCDVTKEADILKAFGWVETNLGGVDVLINNAGIIKYTQIVSENNTADLKAVLDVNVLGVALCTREAYRSMKGRNVAGHIIIVNSVLGHVVPVIPGGLLNIYPPSKHAVTAMTEVLRQEFAVNKTKIKVTSVSPGLTDTDILMDITRKSGLPMLKAEDVSSAILYCLQTAPHVQVHELILQPLNARL